MERNLETRPYEPDGALAPVGAPDSEPTPQKVTVDTLRSLGIPVTAATLPHLRHSTMHDPDDFMD